MVNNLYNSDYDAWVAEQNSPSLKNHLIAVLNECYIDGKDLAATETELPWESFPNDCPFSIEQILNPEFLPGN